MNRSKFLIFAWKMANGGFFDHMGAPLDTYDEAAAKALELAETRENHPSFGADTPPDILATMPLLYTGGIQIVEIQDNVPVAAWRHEMGAIYRIPDWQVGI